MTTLKVLELIDADGRPTEELNSLVHAEGDDRRMLLRQILERFYTPVFALDLSRASRGQFHEAFRSFGTKEGVLTKCEAFFIRAAQDAELDLSRHILQGRHGANRTRTSPAGRSRSTAVQAVTAEKKPVPPESAVPAQVAQLELADRILAKYPDFDPSWDPAVQAKWLEGMTRLYEGLSVGASERPGEKDTASEEELTRPNA